MDSKNIVTHLIREAQENRVDAAILWLYLKDAYRLIKHKLVECALYFPHVPSNIKDLILNYYNNFRSEVTSGSVTSAWLCLVKGIIKGCTIYTVMVLGR